MKVTRKSMITGVNNTMEIDVSLDQIRQWETGTLIQNAMPHLNPDEREFIKTGITPEEWESNLTNE
ncbi:MAG: hypothetical protein COC02_06480 [Rhodospirillaceae bacterium]|nr:MAG: hypothetical protein COC02_06480 [Rhodospirillaceae bacterium]